MADKMTTSGMRGLLLSIENHTATGLCQISARLAYIRIEGEVLYSLPNCTILARDNLGTFEILPTIQCKLVKRQISDFFV